ncbi:MAG: helix-turn-helix transcriptional regulator [Blastomonas sp.]
MSDPVESLTEAQKSCLRLVTKGLTSKEIALELDLSPMTVDQYLHKASTILAATNRRDAARKFAKIEKNQGFKQFELKPAGLVPSSDTGMFGVSTVERDERSGWLGFLLRMLLPPPLGGRENDLSAIGKSEAIIRVAVLSLIVFTGIALLIRAVLRTFS